MSDSREAANKELRTKNQEQPHAAYLNSPLCHRHPDNVGGNLTKHTMKTKIPHLILAGLFGTAIASQGAIVYTENFTPAPGPIDESTSGLNYFNGSGDEYWIGALNRVDYSGNLTINFDEDRGRGAVVWLDASSWVGSAATIAFDVSDYTGAGSEAPYFQAYYANNLSPGNSAGFDVHQGLGGDLTTNATGIATMGTASAKNLITANGTDLTYSFDTGDADWIALVFYSTGDIASFDNISLSVVPEPSSTALLGLGGLALALRRRRS